MRILGLRTTRLERKVVSVLGERSMSGNSLGSVGPSPNLGGYVLNSNKGLTLPSSRCTDHSMIALEVCPIKYVRRESSGRLLATVYAKVESIM